MLPRAKFNSRHMECFPKNMGSTVHWTSELHGHVRTKALNFQFLNEKVCLELLTSKINHLELKSILWSNLASKITNSFVKFTLADAPKRSNFYRLTLAAKAVDNAAGPSRLFSTLLIFDLMLRVPVPLKHLPIRDIRMKDMKAACNNMTNMWQSEELVQHFFITF